MFFIGSSIAPRDADGFPYLAVKYYADVLPFNPAILGPTGRIVGEIAHCCFKSGAITE